MDLAPEVEQRLWSDAAILRDLEDARKAFESGDRSALMFTVFRCARFQAVPPEWAADALLEIERKLESGELQDANTAFGWKMPDDPRKRRREVRQHKYADAVLSLLMRKRLEGENLNADEMFQSVADELHISRRDVEAIYKREGQFVRDLPRGGERGIYGFFRPESPPPRRRGRPTLKDF